MPDPLASKTSEDVVAAVFEGILGNIRGDERAGGWKVILDVPETESGAIAKAVAWYRQRVRVVVLPVPD